MVYPKEEEENTFGSAKVRQIFCNYYMDLDYEQYMPKEYFLDGFNATTDSKYYKDIHGDN